MNDSELDSETGKQLASAVVSALADVSTWVCSCGSHNWRERCQRCLAMKPAAKAREKGEG